MAEPSSPARAGAASERDVLLATKLHVPSSGAGVVRLHYNAAAWHEERGLAEAFLIGRGLTNYWGHNTIGYFAPHNGYSAAVRAGRPGGQVAEFRAMVDALHGSAAGNTSIRAMPAGSGATTMTSRSPKTVQGNERTG